MSKDDKIYLDHILQSIKKIERFLENKDAFKDEELIQDAVIRNLQTMAESTQRLSDKIKLSIVDVPWRDISDFRNKLVHDYLGIDLDIIYDVIENELPILKERVLEILKKLEN